MWQYAAKILVTVAVLVAVSELGKRSTLLAAVLVSLPITSLLAFVWLYADTGNVQTVAVLSRSIFWLLLASLPLFIVFPALLDRGFAFWPALFAASCLTIALYYALIRLLEHIGVRL